MSGRAWLLIAGLLALSILFGLSSTFGSSIQLASAVLILTIAPVLVSRHVHAPDVGVRLLLVTAVLLPVEFFLGATALSLCFFYAAFLVVAWLLHMMLVERRVLLDSSRVVLATVCFIATAGLSFLVGLYPWFPIDGAPIRAQLGGLGIFLLSGGVLLVVAHETTTISQLRKLTWVFIGVGAVALVTMFLPATEIGVGQIKVLSRGTVGSLFFTWLVAMSTSQAIWNRGLSRAARAFLITVTVVTLGRGLFMTFDWASGWIPPLIALGILLLFRYPRLTISAGLLMAAPVAAASGAAWSSLMEGEQWSWMTRVEANRVLQQVIAREPVLGLGPANYHFYTYLYPILGYRSRFNSHNNYTDFLAQGGVVGLFVFGWLAIEALCLAYRLQRRAPDGFSRAYALGTFSGVASSLAAGLLADWIVPFVYNIGILGFRSSLLFWFFVGGLVALKRLSPASAAAARDQLMAIITALNNHAARNVAAPPAPRPSHTSPPWQPVYAVMARRKGLQPLDSTGEIS